MNTERKLGALKRNLETAQQYMEKLNTLVATNNSVATNFPKRIESEKSKATRRIAELESEIALLEKSLTTKN